MRLTKNCHATRQILKIRGFTSLQFKREEKHCFSQNELNVNLLVRVMYTFSIRRTYCLSLYFSHSHFHQILHLLCGRSCAPCVAWAYWSDKN